jgi:hypothetical protein
MGKDSRGTCQASFVPTAISLFGQGFTSDSDSCGHRKSCF